MKALTSKINALIGNAVLLMTALVFCSFTPDNVNSDTNNNEEDTYQIEATGTIDGHEYVDMGLPSGIKWAYCTIGATSPFEYGDFFPWGETTPGNYSYKKNKASTKGYKWLRKKGYIDQNDNLTPEHDAATQNWGSSWRMPTKDEIAELVNNVRLIPAIHDGVKGCLLESKINGNKIFMPLSGWKIQDERENINEWGVTWGSTFVNAKHSDRAYALDLMYYPITNNIELTLAWSYCSIGWPVRAVSEAFSD